MSERQFFDVLLVSWFVLSASVVLVLRLMSAPYGRHARAGWGPTLTRSAGWLLMETPAVLIFALSFIVSGHGHDPVQIAFLLFWQLHYVHRAFIYPMRLQGPGRPMPLLIALLGTFTNIGIGYLIARGLHHFSEPKTIDWFFDPRFIIGTALFFIGFGINMHSDHVLRNLRKPGETEYKIPFGGAYRWVSCPNYLGELIEWLGFAVLTWSLPALAFVVWTASNLVPRARTHHQWYREKFPNYPQERKALLPRVF